MKVDMSPEAIGQRLRTMDDLWLLSVKLMNSERVDDPEGKNQGEPKAGATSPESMRIEKKL